MNRLGNYLNQLREIKGVSFREVSKKTGISHTYLSNLEKVMTLEVVKKLVHHHTP